MAAEIDPHDLIVAVKTRKLLYDKNDKLYGNRHFTINAWREIAEEIGTDEVSARRKWSALRDYFTRQYRVVQSGPGRAKAKKIRWCFYNNLLFLREHLDPKQVSPSLSVKLGYDAACADDMESSSLVNASQIKSPPDSDEESEPETFDALVEEEEEQPEQHRRSVTKRESRGLKRNRKRKSFAHDNSNSNSNSDDHDDDDISGQSMNFDNGCGVVLQPMSSSYHGSPGAVEEDHDELFLKSLLPDLKCVTDEILKMECKIEMQGILLKFIRQCRHASGNQTDSDAP